MSNEKIYKLNEVKELSKKYQYRLGECLDGSGQKVCTSSSLTSKPHIWVDKTLIPFTTRPNNNGIFYVYMYPDTQRKSKPDIYPIQVGKVPANAPINAPQVQPVIVQHTLSENPKDNPLSWESALAYQKEIADLKSENTKLTLQLAQAQKELSEFENDENLSEGEPNAKSFFADLLPVADQFMQNQKQARYLEFLRLASTNPALLQHAGAFVPAGAPQMQAQQFGGIPKRQPDIANDPLILKAQEFIDNLDDNDYAKIEQVKKVSKDLNAMFDNLAKMHPDLYDQLEKFVNA